MPAGSRPRITFAIVAAVLAATAAIAHAAATNVTQITNLSASPKRFCAKASDSCAGSGTTIRFRIGTPAKVLGHIRPRKNLKGGYRVVARRFPAGTNTFRITETRLTTGRWTINLQAVNSVGAGPPATLDVQVVK
jgi:hypothetical protein